MVTEQIVMDFLAENDYDVRESRNGRWIDQKCTPDVLSFQADCIYNYVIVRINLIQNYIKIKFVLE